MEATEDIYVLPFQKNKYPTKNAEAKHQQVLHCMNMKCKMLPFVLGKCQPCFEPASSEGCKLILTEEETGF